MDLVQEEAAAERTTGTGKRRCQSRADRKKDGKRERQDLGNREGGRER